MHTPANLPQLLLMELVRRLIANQQGAVLPRTIGPAPVPPRPLIFPNDRLPPPVSRPHITTLPNPGTGHGRGVADVFDERLRELRNFGAPGAAAASRPLLPIVPPGGVPAIQPPRPPLRVIGAPPPGDQARQGITTLPNPSTGHGRGVSDIFDERVEELRRGITFWRSQR
ncbi:MAG: hypothetical protein M3464_12120 [Chloroflexota bacterium]|nr:hypothetical protein [Chloroflexota bacterium]